MENVHNIYMLDQLDEPFKMFLSFQIQFLHLIYCYKSYFTIDRGIENSLTLLLCALTELEFSQDEMVRIHWDPLPLKAARVPEDSLNLEMMKT